MADAVLRVGVWCSWCNRVRHGSTFDLREQDRAEPICGDCAEDLDPTGAAGLAWWLAAPFPTRPCLAGCGRRLPALGDAGRPVCLPCGRTLYRRIVGEA